MKSYSDFTVVLPTLNEQGTVGKVIEYLLSKYKGVSVIVADDGSDDDTKKIVLDYSKKNKTVTFLDRHALNLERGLTASIVNGIGLSKTKYVIVMDADLQHPPGRIKEIAEKLNGGNDLVVAYRADVTNWAFHRKIISMAFMIFGKLVLLVENRTSCRDILSGFFGVDTGLFTKVYKKNERRFVKDGYKVLFDFLKCIDRGTLAIDNVPFVFEIRRSGGSKAGLKQGIALLRSFFT